MERDEASEVPGPGRGENKALNIVAWVLAVGVGAVFFATGLMKLMGSSRELFPGAAMLQHPVWFRSVVGVAEAICGMLLLIPVTSSFAAVAIALMMIGAMITLLAIGQPGVMFPALMFAMALALAWIRRPIDVSAWVDDELHREHKLLREAIISGFLGATAIAIWFLIVDTVMGRPFFTPALLGRSLLSLLGPTPTSDATWIYVAGYTVVHYVMFFIVGLVAVSVIQWATHQPAVLAGAVILFVAFEIIFHGLVAVLQETTDLGALSWIQIMLGNLIAAAVMGVYLWKQHPELKRELDDALGGTDEHPIPEDDIEGFEPGATPPTGSEALR